jgi:hypothetical protein
LRRAAQTTIGAGVLDEIVNGIKHHTAIDLHGGVGAGELKVARSIGGDGGNRQEAGCQSGQDEPIL